MTRGLSVTGLLIVATLVAAGCSRDRGSPPPRLHVADVLGGDAAGFARALEPRPFVFPDDHGPHPEFRTEWWYVTGHLDAAGGRRFGFQLTFFRNALAPEVPVRRSRWAVRDVYLAHFALTDVDRGRFVAFERVRRASLGLAGASARPLRVALDDWSLQSVDPRPSGATWPLRLRAAQDDVALDLELDLGKPPVAQGDRGLSRKSADPGNASYYYSLTRMPARGRLRTAEESLDVSGLAWLDREWSTSSLGADQIGWDWFALALDDGRDLMFYRLRRRDGSAAPESGGTLIATDGSPQRLPATAVVLRPTTFWTPADRGARYPATWRLEVPADALTLDLAPRVADQELRLSFRYWEGAVDVRGTHHGRPIGGRGYVEMTGYADADRAGGPRRGSSPSGS